MTDLVPYAIPAFVLSMALDFILCRRRGLLGYEARDTAASLAMGIGNLGFQGATRWLLGGPLFAWIYEHRLVDLGTGAAAWVALFFLEDLTYYAWHRASHEVRILWAGHESHHSSERYNLSTALRQSWTSPLTTLPFFAWLPLVGFHPMMVLAMGSISLIYQFWIHTEVIVRMPAWFEAVFNTPSHHRVHHGVNVEYLDRNHAGILIVWDRLFGTFEPERAPVRYGLTKPLDTFRPDRIAFHEWASMARQAWRAPTLRAALGHVFSPPGWSPDGSTRTARELRRDAAAVPGA
jgi:sterol desaturase/sphingolipid hydroxylase (fatty acid hydroxylase superfamily)